MSTPTLLFRRRGTVVARRLDSARTWFTEADDALEAQAGDWWVVDERGRHRSVRDEEFRATYELVHGDVYRRTGVMRARLVRDTETVQTLEGAATAQPGMWIVTNAAGDSWPVPDPDFRSGYQLLPPEELASIEGEESSP